MAEVPVKFSELSVDLLSRNDFIAKCKFCDQNDIKVVAQNAFMCNF